MDHFLILSERHLRLIVTAYVTFFNASRPHQGIEQEIPDHIGHAMPVASLGQPVVSMPVLGGLHHTYSRVA
ncbi:MAG TPA: hypothetical protein VHP83_12935 [Aggregatilineaceae bacterium]|nr:hypothetical protein [Aggregatilineaceae bacterium]